MFLRGMFWDEAALFLIRIHVLIPGGRLLLLKKVEFEPEVSALSPAAIKFEMAMVVIDKRQPQTFVAANRPIPTPIGIGDMPGETANPREGLVSDAHDIRGKVVTRIAQMPGELAAAFAGAVPIRRDGIVGVAEPPHRVELLAGTKAPIRLGLMNKH